MNKFIYNQRFAEFIIIIISGALYGTPLQLISISSGIFISLIFLTLFGHFIFFEKKSNSKGIGISKNYLLLLLLIPLISAIKANVVFGQSILNGISSNLNFIMYLSIIYFYYYFKNKKNPILLLQKSIQILGWFSLLVLCFFKIIYPEFSFTIPSFDGTTEYTYKMYSVSSPFIVWVGFIYLAKFKVTNKLIDIIFFLLFVSFPIIFFNARTFTLMLLLCLIIFFVKELRTSRKLKLIGINTIVIFAFIIIYGLSTSLNKFVDQKVDLFGDAFSATKGNNVDDFSANARVLQVGIALSYINDNLLLGSGVLRDSTKNDFLNEYFYPSDIGLIGVLFNFGIIGMLILMYQFNIFYNIFKDKTIRNDNFILGTTYYLLLQYFTSIFTGSFVYGIGLTFFLLGIIVYGKTLLERQINDSNSIS